MTSLIELEETYTSGVYGKRPVAIVRGQGALVWDAEGREYIDCAGGHGVANIGHGRPEIAAALAAQAQNLITCPEIFYNDTRARLLERLAQLVPEELTRIFLCNSGTEAVEGALKFARLATGRSGIVATLRGFHGRTMGALSATWEPHYRQPFEPLVPDVTHIRYNDLAAAEAAVNEQTAAVIIELVQGEGGVHIATEEYIHGLASLCRERGALLIIDEVQTGFGRTGSLFACAHYSLQPDILCLAKSLAGGVPMGAICLGPRVTGSGRITKGAHGSTFGGNPLACAAALTTLDILEREGLAERAARLGAYALERLRALRSPLIRQVRGRGLLIGIELTRRVQPYLETLLEHGVLALPAGPNTLRLLPPLVISEEQLEQVLAIIEEMLVRQTDVAGTPTVCLSMPGGEEGRRHTVGVPATSGDSSIQTEEVRLLHDMLTIPSFSGQESALAHFLVGQARRMGLHAYVDEVGNFVASTHAGEERDPGGSGSVQAGERDPGQRGSLLSETEQAAFDQSGTADRRHIVLLGHMDTVRGNIPVRLEDGILYGRGAVDAKGPLAAFLCATARLARSGLPARPVVVIGAIEEEAATSRGARGVVQRYQPAACIIGEPSGSQAVTIGYKGRLLVEYRVVRPLSHSAGPRQSSNEVAVTFWNRVSQHASEWNQQHAGNSAFAALSPSLRSMQSAQDGLEEQAHLLIGYRLPPGYDIAALRAQLQEWAGQDEAEISFSGEETAFQTTRAIPLARSFIAAIRAVGGQPTFKRKTGTSDMNVVGPCWGQNIVAYGPGDSSLDHTPQEHIHVAEYVQAIDVLERVLGDLVQAMGELVSPLSAGQRGVIPG